MVILPKRNKYTEKDQLKANVSNKFIGLGSAISSTNAYRLAYGPSANCGVYRHGDVVFVSAEGNRRDRVRTPWYEMDLAIEAGVTFVTDDESNRNRSYNVGERLVAQYLKSGGYIETQPQIWEKK